MASYPKPNFITNLVAASALTSSQYKAVYVNSAGKIAVAGAGANAIGFLHNAPAADAICEVATVGGGAKAIAGGTITAGSELEVDANGDLVVTAGAAENTVAIALESAVDGDIFAVLPSWNKVANTA